MMGQKLVAFGVTRDEAEAAATQLFGEPAGRDSNDECGAGAMEFTHWASMTLNFQDGAFAGWSVHHPNDIPTAFGLSTVTPRTEAMVLSGFALDPESTLGEEFTVRGISGLLGKEGVESLWAGTNCIFR